MGWVGNDTTKCAFYTPLFQQKKSSRIKMLQGSVVSIIIYMSGVNKGLNNNIIGPGSAKKKAKKKRPNSTGNAVHYCRVLLISFSLGPSNAKKVKRNPKKQPKPKKKLPVKVIVVVLCYKFV